MPTNIPATVPSFVTLQDDIDYVLSLHQNQPNDEITALATYVGMMGTGKNQSYGTDILAQLMNGYPIITKVSDNSFQVSAGALVISNVSQSIRMPRRNSSDTPVTAANIDTGSLQIAMYYVYAVADTAANTFDVVFSLSDTSPTGYTNYKFIGWFYNESNGALNIANSWIGNYRGNASNAPNVVERTTDTDSSTNSNGVYVDMPETEIQFYSSGRPVLLILKAVTTGSANANGARAIFNIDGNDVINSDGREISADVQLSDDDTLRGNISLNFIHKTLAAGAHTLKVRYMHTTSPGETHVYQRQTAMIEL